VTDWQWQIIMALVRIILKREDSVDLQRLNERDINEDLSILIEAYMRNGIEND